MDGANAFKRGTKKLHNRMWWQNMRCNLILLAIFVGILLGKLPNVASCECKADEPFPKLTRRCTAGPVVVLPIIVSQKRKKPIPP